MQQRHPNRTFDAANTAPRRSVSSVGKFACDIAAPVALAGLCIGYLALHASRETREHNLAFVAVSGAAVLWAAACWLAWAGWQIRRDWRSPQVVPVRLSSSTRPGRKIVMPKVEITL